MMSTRFSNGFENFIWFIFVRPKRYPKQNLVKSYFCDQTKMLYSLATGHRGSQGNKSNRVDRVFQANEATQWRLCKSRSLQWSRQSKGTHWKDLKFRFVIPKNLKREKSTHLISAININEAWFDNGGRDMKAVQCSQLGKFIFTVQSRMTSNWWFQCGFDGKGCDNFLSQNYFKVQTGMVHTTLSWKV